MYREVIVSQKGNKRVMYRSNHPPRDGVWLANGLSADFRFIKSANGNPLSYVETAVGEYWALDSQLTYDPVRDLSPEAAAVVAKETP